jgi:hypothetical protein
MPPGNVMLMNATSAIPLARAARPVARRVVGGAPNQ